MVVCRNLTWTFVVRDTWLSAPDVSSRPTVNQLSRDHPARTANDLVKPVLRPCDRRPPGVRGGPAPWPFRPRVRARAPAARTRAAPRPGDRKSTRLNSSHDHSSYAD